MMKKAYALSIALVFIAVNLSISQEKDYSKPESTEVHKPVPAKITPGENNKAPSDAIILFDGHNLNNWVSANDAKTPAKWTVKSDGSMEVKSGSGDIQTKQKFGDIQLHIEWKNPTTPRAKGQKRANSGVFLQGRYEIQVLDNYNNKTYVNGQAGSVYKQHIPLVNATKPSGEWQTYDIIYHAPIFDSTGRKTKSATVTVLHNGVLIQDNVTIYGTTVNVGIPKNNPHSKGPIKLQDHNDNSGVNYRNIWVREL